MEPKQKQYPAVDVTGDRSKVQCCKEQYFIGTWNVRSMNQGKLEVVKQEMARVNIDILGSSELKWTGMGEFNSDNHYIYFCGQESLRRNGVAIMVNKRVQNAVQFSSVTQSCPTLCDAMNHSTPGLPVHHQLPEITQTNVHQVTDASQPSHPLSSPSPPAPNPSQHQSLFQLVKDWSFSFSISSSKEHPGLIFFRMSWLDLLAVQGTLRSLLQHHSSKASILRCSAFLTVQLSHPYT